MTGIAQQDEYEYDCDSDSDSDSDFNLISISEHPNPTSSPPTSTPSPVEIDRDYNLLNHLWIGMYPDSERGRTGLDHTSYPRYLFERHIPFDEPESRHGPGPGGTRGDSSRQMVFCIDELIHVGQLWDIYRGELIGCDGISKPQSLILKIMRPSAFPTEYPPDPEDPRGEDQGYHIQETAIAAAFREDWIYRNHLTALQGGIVPIYHGLFTWYESEEDRDRPDKAWLFAMILEDVGDPDEGCRGGSYLWEWDDNLRIDQLYKTLHEEAQLVHDAVEHHHIIRSQDNTRMSIVDFQDAWVYQNSTQERKRDLLETEEGALLYMIHAWRDAQGQLTENP